MEPQYSRHAVVCPIVHEENLKAKDIESLAGWPLIAKVAGPLLHESRQSWRSMDGTGPGCGQAWVYKCHSPPDRQLGMCHY